MQIPVGSSMVHRSPHYTNYFSHYVKLRFLGNARPPVDFFNEVICLPSFMSVTIYHPSLTLYGVDLILGDSQDVTWTQLKYADNVMLITENMSP